MTRTMRRVIAVYLIATLILVVGLTMLIITEAAWTP